MSLIMATSWLRELHGRCKMSDDQVLGSLDPGWVVYPVHHSMAHKMERWEGAGIHMDYSVTDI